jgi:RNA ligase (TIGR02306 family)
MRKLATIGKISDIQPIEGADAIECAQVDGWKVVVKKGEFQAGQLATYLEVDSWVPESVAPFLCRDDKEYNGVRGARLRTIKLRGQISQGLLLPAANDANEGEDVTDALGIQKYEPPVPAQLAGQVRGNFPSFIPKTDQERIQNLGRELEEWAQQDWAWEVTEKLDGSSMTAYLCQGDFGVCSRNLDLKEDENNSFWKAARANNLDQVLRALDRNLALQGELIGEGIQKNRYGIKGQQFYLFDIYDIEAGRYLSAKERRALNAEVLNLHHAPVISDVWLTDASQAGLLEEAEGKSQLNAATEREGLVYKCHEKELSFKAISNKFLLADKS